MAGGVACTTGAACAVAVGREGVFTAVFVAFVLCEGGGRLTGGLLRPSVCCSVTAHGAVVCALVFCFDGGEEL